ncbi:FkbM family methyltransferase [bacterium]|jgi:FkbM family methyltransferase|nr:FkbM family methyltransferase [bacterium]
MNIFKKIYYHLYPRETDGLIKEAKKYLNLKVDVQTVFDVGSRDCEQSVEFHEHFPSASIFAFEANPQTVPICEKIAANYDNITVIPKAVNDYDGTCTFYQIDTENYSASPIPKSYKNKEILYKAGGSSLIKHAHFDVGKGLNTKAVDVNCTRLDSFCTANKISTVDILWMDLEGAEFKALQSLGPAISKVKIMQLEAQIHKKGSSNYSFEELRTYLSKYGFDYVDKKRVDHNIAHLDWATDVVFINTTLLGPVKD